MKNLDRLIARAAETHKYFKGQTDLDYVAIDIKQANAIKAEVDARIAELTEQLSLSDRLLVAEMRAKDNLATEVADLKSKLDFANAMNADQDKTVAELTAEVARLVESHRYIVKTWPDSSAARHSRSTVARNALKDGV